MMIDFAKLIADWQLEITGVIHVGAHYGQEYTDYIKNGIEDCIFIEPCQDAVKRLHSLGLNERVTIFNCACGSEDAQAVMYVSPDNEGQSNSLLRPLDHLQLYPHIRFIGTELVPVRVLDGLPITRSKYNLLVMDAQGYELKVLQGARETIGYIDYILTEVNNREMYEGNVRVKELDDHLWEFQRVYTYWVHNQAWGDALYIRKSLLKPSDKLC